MVLHQPLLPMLLVYLFLRLALLFSKILLLLLHQLRFLLLVHSFLHVFLELGFHVRVKSFVLAAFVLVIPTVEPGGVRAGQLIVAFGLVLLV